MSILVAYASEHGATGEITERIAQGLRAARQPDNARPVQPAGDLGDFRNWVQIEQWVRGIAQELTQLKAQLLEWAKSLQCEDEADAD